METSSLNVDLNAKCFAFVVGFCTSMSNNYDSKQINLEGSKYHKNSKSHDFRSSSIAWGRNRRTPYLFYFSACLHFVTNVRKNDELAAFAVCGMP